MKTIFGSFRGGSKSEPPKAVYPEHCSGFETGRHCICWRGGQRCCGCLAQGGAPQRKKPLQLTEFQVRSLEESARAPIPNYLLVLPNELLDSPEQMKTFTQSNADTDQLIEHGLIEDVTDKYQDNLREHLAKGGRQFRVLKITDIGKAMFNGSSAGSPLN